MDYLFAKSTSYEYDEYIDYDYENDELTEETDYFLNIEYYNTKKLRIKEFIELIKDDIQKSITKNRIFNIGKFINFIFYYDLYCDSEYCTEYWNYYRADKNFGANGIFVKSFVKDLVNCVKKDYIIFDSNNEIYYNKFGKEFIVSLFEISILVDIDKINHKRKLYKVFDELLEVAWNPDRINYLDWCLDFEELRDLKERWGIN